MKRTRIITLISLATTCLFSAIILTVPSHAATSDNILNKALLEGIYTCYTGGHMNSDLGVLSNYTSYSSLIDDDGDGTVKLPNGFNHTISDNDLRCSETLAGYSRGSQSITGLFARKGITPPTSDSSADSRDAFLKGMGYNGTEASNGQCVAFLYKYSDYTSSGWTYNESTDDQYTYSLCAAVVNADGTIGVDQMEVVKDGGHEIVEFEVNKTGQVKLDCALYNPFSDGGCEKHTFTKNSTKWTDFASEILADLAAHYSSKTTSVPMGEGGVWTYTYTLQNTPKYTAYGEVNASYEFSTASTAGSAAVKYLSPISGITGWSGLKFTQDEVATLYQTYLEDFYSASIVCDPDEDTKIVFAAGGNIDDMKVRLYDSSAGTFNSNCYAKTSSSSKVNGVYNDPNADNYFHFGKTGVTFSEVLSVLNSLTITDLEDPIVGNIADDDPYTTPSDTDDEVDEDPCYAEAGVLGWIMCPVVRMLDENMTEIYGWVENNFLSTRADIFADDAYGIKTTWGKFRDIANIPLAIMMLIIVISQVTGFGVSNYGIKKMLPRIIITAVLINLSYIVCVLAIDLSNILGYRLKELLENLVVVNNSVAPGGTGSGFVIGSLAIIGATVAVILNPAILITLLLFLLSGLISVLFLWILLVTRQAGIILGVILSPVALACYMLPNTQNFFKRYTKMMQGLLMLYPICGLVVGGGIFASKVMVNVGAGLNNDTGQSAFMLAGMALQVLPFFFIPTLLKGSFAAIGNIGAKISSFGSRVGGGATRGIRNMDAVKDAQRRGMERKMRLRAGLDKEGNVAKGRLARLASIGPGRNRRRAAASSAIDKNYAINRYGDAAFLAAQAATRETTQQENEVKAQEALVKNMRDSSGLGKLLDNTGEMETAYRNALLGLDEHGNAVTDAKVRSARIKAYQNLLSAKGDDGRQAVHRAVTDAQNGVAIGGVTHRASDEALRTHASNLVNKHGGAYKADSRSTFNHANGILGGSAQAMATYENDYASLVNSVKDETLGSMDDAEFGRLCSAVQADPTGSAAQSLADAAYAALQNDAAMAGVKAGRKNELQLLAANSTQQQQINADAVADAAAQQAAATAEAARIAREDQQFQVHQASTREQIYAQHEHNIQSAGRLTQDQNFGTSIVGPQPVIRAGEYMPPAIFDPSKAQISGGIVTTGNPTGERWIVQGEHRFNLRTGQFDRNYTPPAPKP